MILSFQSRHRGMTLIELVITIAIIGILITLGVNSFSRWISNLRIRSAADSIQFGIQLARTEAVKRNSLVYFTLVDSLVAGCQNVTSGTDLPNWNWIVSTDRAATLSCPAPSPTNGVVQVRPASEGSGVADIRVNATVAEMAFDGFGRLVIPAANAGVLVSMGGAGNCGATDQAFRCLRIQVTSPGGLIRLCDPVVTNASDPRFCL